MLKKVLQKIFKRLNDLNPRQLLILTGIIMLVMFAVIYFFMSWWTARESAKMTELAPKLIVTMQTVVIAKKDIPPQTIITADMLETKEVPEELVPEDAVTDTAKIINLSAKSAIFTGDVITGKKLFSDLDEMTFVGSIPKDCRAVSISVNEITGVDGFAKSGDRVDLVLVETDENKSASANILLQDVLLLSINKDMSKDNLPTEGTATTSAVENPSIATFALRPNEVLKLVSASKLGEIYLMLRPKNPTENDVGNIGYTIDSINAYKQKQEVPQVSTPPVMPPIPADIPTDENKIEIIQGDQIVQKK